MTAENVLLPFTWVLNGLLLLAYLLLENIVAVSMLPVLIWLSATTVAVQRPWMLAASILAMTASILAPSVAGIWLLLMSVGSLAALKLEKFNPDNLRWRIAGGIAMYALVALGVRLYAWLSPLMAAQNESFSQGQGYLNVITGVALWIFPLGFVGLLLQAIWAHPPIEAAPAEMMHTIRTRNRRD